MAVQENFQEPSGLVATLRRLYGEEAEALTTRLLESCRGHSTPAVPAWSQRDAWLITYPDQFRQPDMTPLAVLERIYSTYLDEFLNGIHVLPCYPWTSDDGYAVTDHMEIDPNYGDWTDIERLAGRARVMLDAVVNHMSASSGWFRSFLGGDPAFAEFFRTASPESDLSATVRPRATPLLTPFEAHDGRRWVWTTFSEDQVDLDYRNPEVFFNVARVLFEYSRRGAQMIRLDAVQFLGKREGTGSINLPEAHLIVQALRQALDLAYPSVLLVSESNVPHAENLAYLGEGTHREAQVVYQFALAPLVLHSMITGDATALKTWIAGLPPMKPGVTVLNFLASHDGVAVRPVESILTAPQLGRIVDHTESAGGQVNVRALPDGSTTPYELASTWFDLMAHGYDEDQALARHLASHAVMLALKGIPAIYVHSLFGTSNDHALATASRMARSLNRHKFADVSVLERQLADPDTRGAKVLTGLGLMLARRRKDPGFHPDVEQTVLETAAGVLGIQRGESCRVYVNLTGDTQPIETPGWEGEDGSRPTWLDPWQSAWVRPA